MRKKDIYDKVIDAILLYSIARFLVLLVVGYTAEDVVMALIPMVICAWYIKIDMSGEDVSEMGVLCHL